MKALKYLIGIKKMFNNDFYIKPFLLLAIFTTFSCVDFLDIDPPTTSLTSETVFANDRTAESAMIGVYSNMMNLASGSFVNYQISLYSGLLSDEFRNASPSYQEFYENQLTPVTEGVNSLWRDAYQYIYQINSVLEGLSQSNTISPAIKSQLEGEARFLRALHHFYLVNLFGNIPYITTTDYSANNLARQISTEDVYQMIVSDLLTAKDLLSDEYSTEERIRPNRSTAISFLARVYAYQGNWEQAELQSSIIINDIVRFHLEDDLNDVFLATSQETIWQLKPVLNNYNTVDGNFFIPTTAPSRVVISDDLVNSFEENDLRKSNWIGNITINSDTFYFPFKYKVKSSLIPTEYTVVFRLAEQYLIRAEARAYLNKTIDSILDLNVIRLRAGLNGHSVSLTQNQILMAVETERRLELMTEMGHRWLDLKRTNRANEVLSTLKGAKWDLTDVLLPIPKPQIDIDPHIDQNDGY